ncbi:hypothetical protein BX616_001663, partial [Lobosporangium transversale]
ELLLVFSHLQKRLTEKFSVRRPSNKLDPESELADLARYTGVSGFVFLRLICAAILTPKLFYIVREHPEARAHRTLTLIAKSLQGLANLVMFGIKEAWMVPMNEFIALADTCYDTGSSTNSVRSIPMQAPHSPGSTNSSVFQGTTNTDNNTHGNASPRLNNLRSSIIDTVLPPVGDIEHAAILDQNQDMPLLPHMIDLGKELAHFTNTVARVIPHWPHEYQVEAEAAAEVMQDDEDLNVNGNPFEGNDRQRQQYQLNCSNEQREEDILRKVGQACWDVVETIQERVQLTVELEQEERLRTAAAAAAVAVAAGTSAGAGGAVGNLPYFSKAKVSREGFRDGEESYVVYEHYDGMDHELESFDGYERFDSDDESFIQQSAYE